MEKELNGGEILKNYFGVDFELVWDIIIHEIPPLRENDRGNHKI